MKKLLFISLLAIAACKKTDDGNSLPGPSSTGQNYLACKVNGEVRLSKGLNTWTSRTGVSYTRFANDLTFGGDNDDRRDDLGIHLQMSPDSVQPNITYLLGGETNQNYVRYTTHEQFGNAQSEYYSSDGSGWVRFSRVDSAVAAGTFAFTAYRNGQKGADSVVVTDGRFDITAQ